MVSAFFPLCGNLWLNWNANTGVIHYLGFTLNFPAKSEGFYHFLNGLHYKTTSAMYVFTITLAIFIYGPKRLWEASTAIHPLRLFNYVLACFGILFVLNHLVCLFGIYPGDPAKHYVPAIAERLAHVVFGPIAEEFFFRLTLFQLVRSKLGFLEAALISSAAFGLYHFSYPNPMKMVAVSIAGLVLAWAYEKTGTILAPIGIHVLHNTWSQFVGY